MSDFEATKVFLDRQGRPFITDGRVVNVEGLIAKVRLRGNPGIEEANIPPGNLVSPGDYVLLFRPEGVSNWIIASSYVPDKILPTRDKSVRRGNRMVINASNSKTVMDGGNLGLRGIGSFDFSTTGGHIAIFYSGYLVAQTSLAYPVTLAVTATINGKSIAQHSFLARASVGKDAPPVNEISFSELAMNIPAGQHTIGVSATLDAGPAIVEVHTMSFWAMEV